MDAPRRAVGIIRVSVVKGREGESFASPEVQRDRIEAECARQGLRLVEVFEELDVSGGKPLDRRPGLRQAVAAIESGHVEIVVASYFDRLFRSLQTQAEVIDRVEVAGGQVMAVDVGQITNGSAANWLNGTMHGAMAEYFRRQAREKSVEAIARAVDRGVVPWPSAILGYRRIPEGPDKGRWEVVPENAALTHRAYEMRAAGVTQRDVQRWLKEQGHDLRYGQVRTLLSTRCVLGEIHHGERVNLEAFPPIVERDLYERVQRMVTDPGPRPNSDRILARLGVLLCGSCGSRMSVQLTKKRSGRRYWVYRWHPYNEGCSRHVYIGAPVIERAVIEAVRERLSDVEGRASAESHVRDAATAVEAARAQYEAAMRAFGTFTDPVTVRRLLELRRAWDAAQQRLDQLGGQEAAVAINGARAWDRLSLDARRELIRAVIERVVITPPDDGGGERIRIEFYSE